MNANSAKSPIRTDRIAGTHIDEAILDSKNEPQSTFLKVSRLQSIKTKIIVFALLATIAPSLILGVISYFQNSSLLREKISQELRNATDQSSKEFDLWLKERLYDLRVFSSSYIISENLPQAKNKKISNIETIVSLDHIKGYLESVSEKFGLYKELTLLDPSGVLVVTSSANPETTGIPKHWLEQLRNVPPMGTKVRFDPHIGTGSIMIAEGVNATSGTLLGVLVAQIDLDAVRAMFKRHCMEGISEIYLTDEGSRVLVSSTGSTPSPNGLLSPIRSASTVMDLSAGPSDYVGRHGEAVIGMAMPIATAGWMMVAEMDKQSAYAGILKLRRITITLVGGLIFFIGICAYIFGHTLVSPVRRLSRGAARVASGHLDVDIPVTGLSEVSYLTQVFNHMVESLRRGREEISEAHNSLLKTNEVLHQLSITDSLTGLYNRKHIMDLCSHEMARAARYQHPLTILMADIDYFKRINDTYGHQTGDTVVRQLAESLKGSVRECDYVGRYGGEEFLIVLTESTIESGAAMGERIRENIDNLKISAGGNTISVTLSIGIAGYPADGIDMESIIRKADDALYKAKANGRNCVVVSEAEGGREPTGDNGKMGPNLKLVSGS